MTSMSCPRLSFLPGAGVSAGRLPATLALLALFGLGGCATLVRTETFVGACRERLDQCEARCARLKDARAALTCRGDCEHGSRVCAVRQGEVGVDAIGYDLKPRHNVAELASPLVQRVDFSRGVAETSAFGVELRGPTRVLEDVLEIAPGGSLTVDFIPPLDETREATILVEHAAGGNGLPSFVTVVVGNRALVGRYSAPRRGPAGELKQETWDVTAHLAPPSAPAVGTAPASPAARSLKMVIYNNAEASSTAPYYLRRIELRAYGRKK